MKREERCAECVSPDAVKIRDIHTSTGNQYFRKLRPRDTAHRKPGRKRQSNHNPVADGKWKRGKGEKGKWGAACRFDLSVSAPFPLFPSSPLLLLHAGRRRLIS